MTLDIISLVFQEMSMAAWSARREHITTRSTRQAASRALKIRIIQLRPRAASMLVWLATPIPLQHRARRVSVIASVMWDIPVLPALRVLHVSLELTVRM